MTATQVLCATTKARNLLKILAVVTLTGACVCAQTRPNATSTLAITKSSESLPVQIPGGGGATQLTLTGCTVSVPCSQTLPASNGNPPYSWSVLGGALPDGLSLNSAGTLSGTPNQTGTWEFTGQVTDASGTTASSVFLIAVAPQQLTITTASPLPIGIGGYDYPAQILTAAGGTAPYTFQIRGALPGGLTFSAGEISGVPTTSGTFPFTVTATDSSSPALNVSAEFQLTIQGTHTDLILSLASLAFSLNSGATGVPAGASVSVRSSVVGQLLNFSLLVNPAVPWLNATGGATTPGDISINLTPQALSLGAGVYQTSIIVACAAPSPCAGNTQTIQVSLNVAAAAPQLAVTSSLISLSAQTPNPPAVSQTLGLQNIGGGTITVTSVTAANSFVSISGVPATIPAGPAVPVTVTANPNGLSAGYYQSSISVNTSAGAVSIPVTLFLAPNATMTLNPAGIELEASAGSLPGNFNGSFLVSISGNTSVNWTATLLPGASWLTLNTTSGSSTAANPGAVNFSINVNAETLAPGAYYGTIQIASNYVVDSPQSFLVVLNVAPAASLVRPDPVPEGLVFISNGSGAQSTQTVQLFATSSAELTYQASSDSPWLTVTPASGTTTAVSPAASSISVNPSSLTPGIYRGNVTYALLSAVLRTVNVTLIVEAASATSCAPTRLVPTQTGLVNNFAQPVAWPAQVAVTLLNDCGQPVTNGQVFATFSNGDPALPLNAVSTTSGIYMGTWTPRNAAGQVAIVATATAPGFTPVTAQTVGQVTPNAAPLLNENGTLDAFAIAPEVGAPLAPGTIVQIYGSNLAAKVTPNSIVPLPTNLGETSVYIGGMPAPLYYVSPGQINAQVPFELPAGRTYQVMVSANGALSMPNPIQLVNDAPGLAEFPAGQVIATHSDGVSLITETSPAAPDETVVLYLVGMGLTDQTVPSGTASPSASLAHVRDTPTLMLNGAPVTNILFAGLTPTAVGLYQVNFEVPASAPNGDLQLVVTQTSGQSTSAILPVYNPNAPVLTCPVVSSGEVGVAFNSPAPTVTGGTAPYSFAPAKGTLPAGLTLNTSTGAITGTPTASGTFTLQVTDANGFSAASRCPFTIAATPSLTCPAISAGGVGATFSSPAITVSGGTSPYTFSVASGTLPAGLTLNASTGAITGTPTAIGVFTIQMTDANGVVAVNGCPFTIAVAPVVTCPAVNSGEVGAAFNSPALTVTGGTPPYKFSLASGILPAGLTLNATNGAITGTPTAAGTFTIQVADALGIVAASSCPFTIAAAPVVACPAVKSGQIGLAFSSPAFTVTGGTPPYTYSIVGTLPPGLTLNPTSGAITGTPTVAGSFSILVTDAKGVTAGSCLFTIGASFAIISTALPQGALGTPYSFQPLVSGGTQPFTWSFSGLPPGLTGNLSTGLISGTPTVTGTSSVTISVSDSSSPQQVASTTLPLVIAVAPLVITTTSPLPNATTNVEYLTQIAASGGRTPYHWSSSNLPAWLTFDISGTGVCGVPLSLCGIPTTAGTNTFTITVMDSSSPTAQTVSQMFSLTTVAGAASMLTVPSVTVGQGLEVPLTITFNPAPAVGATQCTSSATPGCLTIASSGSVLIGDAGSAGSGQILVPIEAGTQLISVYAQANGAAGGSGTITASLAGYTSGTGNVTIAPSGFELQGPNGVAEPFNAYQGSSTTLTVTAVRLDSNGGVVETENVIGGSTVTVPIASVPTTVGTVSPTSIVIIGGTSSMTTMFTASSVNTGSATVALTQPSGFTAPASGTTLNVTVQQSSFIAPVVNVGQGLEAEAAVSLTGNAPGNTTVTLASSNSSNLQFACESTAPGSGCSTGSGSPATSGTITVTIAQNQTQSANFFAIGSGAPGSVPYTISGGSFGSLPASVTIVPSTLTVQAVSTILGQSPQVTVSTAALVSGTPVPEAVAPNETVTVTVTSNPMGVGIITNPTVTISGGSITGTTTFMPTAVGTATITAAASGFSSGSTQVTVSSGATIQINNQATVGQHLENQNSMLLGAPAPAGGLPVTLSVATGSVGLMQLAVNPGDPGANSITVTVPPGQLSATYYVYGLQSSGTATYSATASGYASATDTVTLAPSGIDIFGTTPSGTVTCATSCNASLSAGAATFMVFTNQLSTDGSNTIVAQQNLAGNVPLSVRVQNSGSGVGTLSSSGTTTITPGTDSGTLIFTPRATGSATLSVTQPTGYSAPSQATSIAITVGP